MNLQQLYGVLEIVDTFRQRAKVAIEQHQSEDDGLPIGFPSKATGALRRTSMELTRALADLRRPG
jgi:hypothetical protein